ncbi:cation diffusion facilitator family transporter [Serpentinicella sp. ANB-PHB4]|uniref:cation diffusion facilitator family transporter n=1 Tax=Serpentinicella sp. ANB-PHB4 TaxID=3074076 RepID=UPI002854F67C|nr:cation diffusion facilitator family transporter [Serpentinicella sp. ANB-PHB4]MDR5659683.1 cation diffusion facilitator family transporter [Serpentinicella sp. ANB-PHB4]
MNLNNNVENAQLNKVLVVTIVINLILVVIKVGIGYLANSRALLADGVHSISDVITSIGVIVSLVLSKKPRDEEHQYGHEKIETVITFLLSIVLLYTGFNIGVNSIRTVMATGTANIPGQLAVFGAIISVALKELQYQYVYRVGKRIESKALMADAWHHRSDAFSSLAALIGIVGSRMGVDVLDAIAAIFVSLIVIKIGFSIFKDCFQLLIDVSINLDKLEEIKELLLKHEEIKNINDIRTRKHGSKVFIDLKVCVSSKLSISKGHQISDEVERIIRSKVKNVKDIVVHLDPCFHEKEIKETCHISECKDI